MTNNGADRLHIDDTTELILEYKDKKLPRTTKEYRAYLSNILAEHGGAADDEMVDQIIAGKTESTIQNTKIKLVDTSKRRKR